MPRTRSPYPTEFRQQIVAMARSGRTPAELAREFEPSEQSIRPLYLKLLLPLRVFHNMLYLS